MRYSITVEGSAERRSPGAGERHFEETYEIEAEHAQPALERLLQGEIEWGILNAEKRFTITVHPPKEQA